MPTIEELALGAVDEADRTFCLTVGGSLADLERSIAAVGQTSPLHVRPQDAERYQLVAGFRRLKVLRLLGRTRILAAVHSREEMPDTAAARLAVFDNLGVRAYNLVEQAMAVDLLLTVGGVDESEVVRTALHALGLQPHAQVLERLRRLLALEEGLLVAIAEEGWPARAVLPLCAWQADARQAFFEIVGAVRPGANKLAELIASLEEIAIRESRSIATVIADLGLRCLALDESRPAQERLGLLREAVRRARYPTLAKMERRAAHLVAKLELEPFVAVRPPKGFEGDAYEARFTFGSPEELGRIGRRLMEAAGHPAASELQSLLSEGSAEEP